MNQITQVNSKTLRAKIPVIVLSVIALLGSVVSFFVQFIDFLLEELPYYFEQISYFFDDLTEYGLDSVDFKWLLFNICGLATPFFFALAVGVMAVTCLFLILYAAKLHQLPKAKVFEAVVFGAMALNFLLLAFSDMIWVLYTEDYWFYSFEFFTFFYLLAGAFFVLAAVESARGKSVRTFRLHAAISTLPIVLLSIFGQVRSTVAFLVKYKEDFDLSGFWEFFFRNYILEIEWVYLAAWLLLSVAFFVFVLKNKPTQPQISSQK